MNENEKPSFHEWLKKVSNGLTWDWRHQIYLYKKLERMTTGESKRLMIFMPPRHGKSETVTVHYAAYRLEHDQKMNIIIGCHNQKLANRFSRRIRRICEAQKMELSTERRAAEEWETASGGGVKAVGVGAGVTGFGAGLIIIDDPVKSRAHAESEVIRDNTGDWFNDDIYTRLEPNGEIVLIQTRWHDDDLSGRLLREMQDDDGEYWDVVKLPAIAEENDALGRPVGEALCPERFDEAAFERVKRRLGSRSFAALYQQDPQPHDGTVFKREWFKRFVDHPPENLQWCRGYDLAVSTKTSADYTASFRCAFDEEGNLYIADGFRGRIEFPEQRKYIIERMTEEKNTRHGIESALHGKAFVQELRRLPKVRGISLKDIRVENDKFMRALGWSPLAEAGKVIIVRGGWNEDFLDEVCRFSGRNDRHDDQVDAVSLAVNMLREKEGKKAHSF